MPTTDKQNLFAEGYRVAPGPAAGLFDVYAPHGKAYIVDAERIHCSCPANVRCKHLRNLGGLIRAQIAHYAAQRAAWGGLNRTTTNGARIDQAIRLFEAAELSLQLHLAFVRNPDCEATDSGVRVGLVTLRDVRTVTAERRAA